MREAKNFNSEYIAFMQEHPYKSNDINGINIQYILGGRTDRPVLVFFHGLEMQEMWIKYADFFQNDYGFFIYEYPLHTTVLDEQLSLLQAEHYIDKIHDFLIRNGL